MSREIRKSLTKASWELAPGLYSACAKCAQPDLEVPHLDTCAVPAFDALLAVVEEAAANDLDPQEKWAMVEQAVQALEGAHPDWREWTA